MGLGFLRRLREHNDPAGVGTRRVAYGIYETYAAHETHAADEIRGLWRYATVVAGSTRHCDVSRESKQYSLRLF
jgi:hypothetical protein